MEYARGVMDRCPLSSSTLAADPWPHAQDMKTPVAISPPRVRSDKLPTVFDRCAGPGD